MLYSNYLLSFINGYVSGFSKFFLNFLLLKQTYEIRKFFVFFSLPFSLKIIISFLLQNLNLKNLGNNKTIIILNNFLFFIISFLFLILKLQFNLLFLFIFLSFAIVCSINEVFITSYQYETLNYNLFKEKERNLNIFYYLGNYLTGFGFSFIYINYSFEYIKLINLIISIIFLLCSLLINDSVIKNNSLNFNNFIIPLKNIINNFSLEYLFFSLIYKSQDFFLMAQLWNYLITIGYKNYHILYINGFLIIPQIFSGYLALLLINKINFKNTFKTLTFLRLILTILFIYLKNFKIYILFLFIILIIEKLIKNIENNIFLIYQMQFYSQNFSANEIAYLNSFEKIYGNFILFISYLFIIKKWYLFFILSFLVHSLNLLFLKYLKQ